jgi:hypothetical protein
VFRHRFLQIGNDIRITISRRRHIHLAGIKANVSFLSAAQLDSSFCLLYTFSCNILKSSTSFVISIRLSKTGRSDFTYSLLRRGENGHKIKYKKWYPVEEREVQWSEIKKGYEVTKNNYVVIEREDIDKIS